MTLYAACTLQKIVQPYNIRLLMGLSEGISKEPEQSLRQMVAYGRQMTATQSGDRPKQTGSRNYRAFAGFRCRLEGEVETASETSF